MSVTEFKLERDRDLLSGDDLVRVRFRRDGERKWRSFVVVLDEETDYATVSENAESLIALYCGRAAASHRGAA